MGVYRLAQTMQTTNSSGNQEPGDSGYEVVTSANGGNAGTDIIGWRRINNPSTSSSTTYRVYSYQAMGINRNNATNQESGQQVIHAWDIEVPGNGALFVRPGQNAQRGVWGDPNNGSSLSYANGYTGGTGGVGQIMIYDPSVSTGTTIDGVATNSILAITSSGAGTSRPGPIKFLRTNSAVYLRVILSNCSSVKSCKAELTLRNTFLKSSIKVLSPFSGSLAFALSKNHKEHGSVTL